MMDKLRSLWEEYFAPVLAGMFVVLFWCVSGWALWQIPAPLAVLVVVAVIVLLIRDIDWFGLG